jgi:hypothetical protein
MGCCNTTLSIPDIPVHDLLPKRVQISSNQCGYRLHGKCCSQQNNVDGHSVGTWCVSVNGEDHIVCGIHIVLSYFDGYDRYQV